MAQPIVVRNPANGEVLRELEPTAIEALPGIFDRARAAQQRWQALHPKQRAAQLLQVRETLLNQADELIDLISQENGKPRFEAMVSEVLPCLESLTYFASRGPAMLKDKKIPLGMMKHRQSYLHYAPLGVVGIISPWNYPFFLPFAETVTALLAGNAVILKPSEVTPLSGMKIQEVCDLAGLPAGLVQVIVGDGALGAALIEKKPAKIFFTGSVATGKKVMAAASHHLVPVNLELGGKDAMIVLPDADMDIATSAALWGGYTNSGQACASVERLLVHEKISEPFLAMLKSKLAKLRPGDPSLPHTDLGVITFENQKKIYETQIAQARESGATFLAGGEFSADRRALQPTLVTGPNIESLDIFNEETFGPVVAVTTFKTVDEAVTKANRSKYGLLASVYTRNLALGEQIARQLEVGTVTVNEVLYTAGLSETPWGGIKDSGFGRSHSEIGLHEFTHIRHIHKPRARFLVFKSMWWFPYTPFQYSTFRTMMELYRRSAIDKLRAFAHFVWNLAQFLKNEKRL